MFFTIGQFYFIIWPKKRPILFYIQHQKYLYENGVRGKKGKTLQFSVVHHMLRCIFYTGWMEWSGMKDRGKHKPLIDEPTFNLVQRVLTEKGDFGIRKRKHNFLLRSIIFCKDCGRRYTGEFHYSDKYKSGNGRIGMYHCTNLGKRGSCHAPSLTASNLEVQVQEEVAKLEFKQEFIEAVKRNIRTVYEESLDRVKLAKKAAYNRRDAIEQKRSRLEEEMMTRNVSGETFKRLNAKLESELLEVQKELNEIEKTRTVDVNIVDEVLRLTQNIVKTYNEVDTDHKRAYLHFFFQKIYVKDKKVVGVEYQPVIAVLNKAKKVILVSDLLENRRFNITKEFNRIIEIFQDFKLVQQIREEIEKVKPVLLPAVT